MGLRGSVMGEGFSYRLKSTSNEEKKGPHSGPFLVWRAMCRMHKCRDKIAGSDFGRRFGGGRKAEDRMSEPTPWMAGSGPGEITQNSLGAVLTLRARGLRRSDQNARAFCRTWSPHQTRRHPK